MNRAERLAWWMSRTPAPMHGDYVGRLEWAALRVAEELGEKIVTPSRQGETWDEILERQQAGASYQPPRGYLVKGYLDHAGRLISRHDRPSTPFDQMDAENEVMSWDDFGGRTGR